MRSVAVTILAGLLAGTTLLGQTPPSVPVSQAPGQTPSQTPAQPLPKPVSGENKLFIELKGGYSDSSIDPDTRGPDSWHL